MRKKIKFKGFMIALFTVEILFWIIWLFRAFAWVDYQDYLVKFLGSFLIVLSVLLIVCSGLLFREACPEFLLVREKKNMRIALISIGVIVIFNLGMLHQFGDYGYTISSIATIQEKVSEGGKYFVKIKDTQSGSKLEISCDKKLYEKLHADHKTEYSLQYRKLSIGKKKAVLGFINKDDYHRDKD